MTDPLAPYREFLVSQRHVDLAMDLFDWMMHHCRCERGAKQHARDAYVGACYELSCGPESAPYFEHMCCAKYVVLTLLADESRAGKPVDLQACANYLSTNTVDGQSELTLCYKDFYDELAERGLLSDLFQDAARMTIFCRMEEQQIDVRTVHRTTHERIRRSTIGMPGFTWLRGAIRGWSFGARFRREYQLEHYLERIDHLVGFANDLGSAEKDRWTATDQSEPCYLNYVLRRELELGDLDAAVEDCVQYFNTELRELAALRTTIAQRAAAEGHATLLDILEVQAGVLDGSVRAVQHMSTQRYPGALPRLARLDTMAS